MKSSAILLVVAVMGCVERPPERRAYVGRATSHAEPAPPPLVIESFPAPASATSAPQRDVFAFRSVSVEDRRSRLSSSSEGQARVPVLHREETTVVPPPEPPAYRYLGSFGPQTKPILVYKGNGDVVNVALGKP